MPGNSRKISQNLPNKETGKLIEILRKSEKFRIELITQKMRQNRKI
jgi:hypothetical protein